jgi:hypothetical protein
MHLKTDKIFIPRLWSKASSIFCHSFCPRLSKMSSRPNHDFFAIIKRRMKKNDLSFQMVLVFVLLCEVCSLPTAHAAIPTLTLKDKLKMLEQKQTHQTDHFIFDLPVTYNKKVGAWISFFQTKNPPNICHSFNQSCENLVYRPIWLIW